MSMQSKQYLSARYLDIQNRNPYIAHLTESQRPENSVLLSSLGLKINRSSGSTIYKLSCFGCSQSFTLRVSVLRSG